MKRILFGILAWMLLLSTCASPVSPASPPPPPSPTPDIVATTSAITGTMVASTLTAQPTATQPPTETPLPTGTATSLPSETPTPTETVTPTLVPFQGTLAPAGLGGTLPTKAFQIENNTSETLRVYIFGVSQPGEKPVYYDWEVTGKFSFDIVWGNFQYTVMVGNKKTFTGTFRINNYDKTVMRVYMTKVIVVGP